MAFQNKSDLNALKRLRERAREEKRAEEKQATSNKTQSITPTNNRATSRTTSSSAPSSSNKSDTAALIRLRERVTQEKAEGNKNKTPTKKYTDYSSAVKYLQDKGIKGASGIMTEREWQRRNKSGGTYQNYLDSVIGKYEKGKPIGSSSYSMTQSEYDMRRNSNSDMPEYGSYEYYKGREEALRPIMKEIANDTDRIDPTYKAWVENYEAGRMPENVSDGVREKVISLAKKFKYQDAIIAEYTEVDSHLKKFDKQGINYDKNGEIDSKSGAEEAKQAKDRYQTILGADALTNLEMAQGFMGELPEDKQKEYNRKEAMANLGLIEADKEAAYNYYEKNKDNVYEDNLGGRFAGNYKIGRIGIKSNSAGFTSYNATSDDIEASEVYQALSSRIQNRNKETFKNHGATDELIAIIGQYAPQGVDQAVIGTVGKVVGSLVGSGNVGKAMATAGYMYEQTAGATYVRLLQESDLSVEDAKKLASSEALSSAMVEFGLDYGTSKLWAKVGNATSLNTSLGEVGTKLTKKMISKGITEKGAKIILNVAKNTGKLVLHSIGEGLEEGWQEGISITADKYAAEGETASPFKMLLQALWVPQYSKDDFKRIGQSFLGGAIIGFGQGGVDALASYGINKTASKIADTKDTRKQQNEFADASPTPLEQTAREIVNERNRTRPLHETLEALSRNNEPITAEDAKKATGFGEEGSKLVAELANSEGVTFSQAERAVKTAYLAGFSNVEGANIHFETDTQINAFTAGKKDRLMQDLIRKENKSDFEAREQSAEIDEYKNSIRNEAEDDASKTYDDTYQDGNSGKTMYDIPEGSKIVNNIVEDEYSKRLKEENPRAYNNITRMARRLGMNVRVVEGLTDENGKVLEGLITSKGVFINANAKNPSRFVATHEFGHRMKQASPNEWAKYQEYVINKLKTQSFDGERSTYDVLYEETKNAYRKDDADNIDEEIAVNYAGELFDSEEMLESFIREDKSLALRVRDWWYNVLESMGLLSEKKKAQQMWLRAYTAAAKNVKDGKVGEYNEKRASQMRNAEGEMQSEETDEQRRKKGFQKNSLIKKIQNNLEHLSKEEVILSLNTDIFNDRNMNIVEQVGAFFDSLGNKVYRADFGEVILNKDGIKSAIGHKMGRAKCIAFRAVPDIIKYGKQIDYQEKWKGRPYDSYVFAGKVKIGNEDAFVGVVVTRNKNTSEYYLHEIVDNEGNFISIKNDEVIPNKTVSKTDNSLHGGINSSVDTTISQDNPSVNTNSMQNTAENTQEGKKSIAGTRLSELVEKYGAIPQGENPHREVKVPRKTEKNKKVSQTVRTILEAKATPDEAVPTIEKMVEDGIFSYDVYTDKKAINDAEIHLKDYGWAGSFKDWFTDVEKGVVSKQHTAMGWALYNNAANIAVTSTSESEKKTAIQTSLEILDAMVRHQRSAAQALQATRILKKLSPETQLYGVQKSVETLQNELSEKYGDKAPDLKIDEDLAEQFINAKTPEERANIEKEIYRDIGRQMPSRFVDKWNAWRYLAMLGNLRTHISNIIGNAGFAPVVMAKDLTASTIESVVYRVSGKKTVRGKALITGNKADRALLKAAWSDYSNVADMISNGGKYNDFAKASQQIEEGRQIFKFKPLEWARKGNSKALETEDMWFSKPHYAYALAQYCKANNISAEQIKKGKAIAPARDYAIKEAQKATYRDTNAFSQMVSEWGRNKNEKNIVKKAFNTVIEGILPFRKTPANILARGVEYSPLGLLKGLSYDLVQVGKGKMTSTEAIDNISAGLTGTGLLALGVYLAAQGLIRGHGEDEEKEKKFNEMMGHQSYSLELPSGQSMTLDWLAPEALPFFVGVNLWETSKGNEEELNLSAILKSVSHITEPMLEMSCLQGLNDLFEGIGYASSNDTAGLVSVVSSAITSYITQGIPSLSGQAERTGEESRMTTYTEKNDFLTGDMQYTLGKASAKIPFWDYNQIPYIDAWGRKEASGTALKRGLNNFLNPAYTSTIETSKMEEELLRLYEQTGEGGVFPERADKYFMVDGVRKDLTEDEYVRYATLKGEKSYKMVSKLVNSKEYKKLSDEEKVKAVKDAYDYANQKAKKAISNYKPEKWVNTADEFGEDAENFIFFRTNISAAREANGGKIEKDEVVDIISDTAQNDLEAWSMYFSMYDSKTALEAEKHGIDAVLFMTAVVDMGSIKADYKSNGKVISGSRRAKIERYLNSVCNSYKEYLFLLGTEYDSVKDDSDYISYFGKK